MKTADYKIVYDKTIEEFGSGRATNITKQRWAGRWRYRVSGGVKYHFHTAKEAREWLTAYGDVITYTINDLIELSSETISLFMSIAPYANMNFTPTDMNNVYKLIANVEYVGKRYKEVAKDSVIGVAMSEVDRDRNKIRSWINHMTHVNVLLKDLSTRKKEYILSKKLDRVLKRVLILEKDFNRWRVEGWEPVEEPKTKLTVVYRTQHQKLAL